MPAAKQIFAFFGTDDSLVKEKALKLSQKLTPPENADFGLELINGRADNADHASFIVRDTIAALQTLPFLGGDKTVWLQDATFFEDNQTGRAAATLAAVDRLQATLESGLAPGVNFVISGAGVDKRRAFYKKLQKLGEVAIFDLPDPGKAGWEQEVMALARKKARELKFEFEIDALEHFVMLTGENTRQINSELEKLCLYVGPGKAATVDDVRAIVATSRAGVIFEIGDALADRNLPRTLELIDYQIRRGESALGILFAAIVPRVRSLLLARDLLENHDVSGNNYNSFQAQLKRLPAAAVAHLPRKKDGGVSAYPIFLAMRGCRRFTVDELKDALRGCLEANRRLVTTQLEPRTVLSQLVTRILTRRVSRAA